MVSSTLLLCGVLLCFAVQRRVLAFPSAYRYNAIGNELRRVGRGLPQRLTWKRSPQLFHPAASAVSASNSADVDVLAEIREAVASADGDDVWRQSLQILSDRIGTVKGGDEEDAVEVWLATAFGWTEWARAPTKLKQLKDKELPDPTKVQAALTWLVDGPLELDDGQLQRVIQEYPKLYLVDPEGLYRQVNGVVPRTYRESLTKLIHDNPNVLQVTNNCDGDGCKAQCGSCWVTYANRLV